jgi:hypothetical protein
VHEADRLAAGNVTEQVLVEIGGRILGVQDGEAGLGDGIDLHRQVAPRRQLAPLDGEFHLAFPRSPGQTAQVALPLADRQLAYHFSPRLGAPAAPLGAIDKNLLLIEYFHPMVLADEEIGYGDSMYESTWRPDGASSKTYHWQPASHAPAHDAV